MGLGEGNTHVMVILERFDSACCAVSSQGGLLIELYDMLHQNPLAVTRYSLALHGSDGADTWMVQAARDFWLGQCRTDKQSGRMVASTI